MAQERVPGRERDGAVLTEHERAAVAAMARHVAAEDPEYHDRLNRLGGYELNPLGLPSRWAALPVAIIGAILAFGVLFAVVVMDGNARNGTVEQSRTHLPK
ncbi:hypothetical protein GCM10027589_29130 [Actinocorallia lasiicapitis]